MRLEQYLEALVRCPDELVRIKGRNTWRLTAKYGIYDNWAIFLRMDFCTFVEYLKSANYSQQVCDWSSKRGKIFQFLYNPGTVILRVMDYVSPGLLTDPDESKEAKEHYKRQQKEFNMGVILYPYQTKRIKDLNGVRALTLVIIDIGKYALRNNIPLCFPDSIGLDNLDDYSQIIYHPK